MSYRKDGKRIASCLRNETEAKLDPAHGNVLLVLSDWLEDGNLDRAARGLEAAVQYEGVRIISGTNRRPKVIGLAKSAQGLDPPDECRVVVALNKLGERVGNETVKVESYPHLGELLSLHDADKDTLEAAVAGMEQQEVLLLCQHVWPWELVFLKTLAAA